RNEHPEAAGNVVHFRTNEPGAEVLIKTGQAEIASYYYGVFHGIAYRTICTAPCNSVLPTGTYDLALALPGHAVVAAPSPLTLGGASTVEAQYISKRGVRAAGVVLAVVSGITGLVLMGIGASATTQDCSAQALLGSCTEVHQADGTLVAGGLAVG